MLDRDVGVRSTEQFVGIIMGLLTQHHIYKMCNVFNISNVYNILDININAYIKTYRRCKNIQKIS